MEGTLGSTPRKTAVEAIRQQDREDTQAKQGTQPQTGEPTEATQQEQEETTPWPTEEEIPTEI
eukprot:2772521-Prorocentrum_lima.AAC.1